jgi:hypothetical protein
MYNTVVRTSVRLREAAASGEPVLAFAPRSGACADFTALAEEVCGDVLIQGRPLARAERVASSKAGPASAPAKGLESALPRRERVDLPAAGTSPGRRS